MALLLLLALAIGVCECEANGAVGALLQDIKSVAVSVSAANRRIGCEAFVLNETECWCFLDNSTVLSGFLGNYTQEVGIFLAQFIE